MKKALAGFWYDGAVKLRCDLHLNGDSRKLLLVAAASETGEHLALKLAAYLLFWDMQAQAEISPAHPALADYDFMPDVLALDEGGSIKLWVECGKITQHKADKLLKRLPYSRLVVLAENEAAGKRIRRDLEDKFEKAARIEVLAWPGTTFKEWLGALREKTEVYGEAGGRSFNLVVNEHPLAVELTRF